MRTGEIGRTGDGRAIDLSGGTARAAGPRRERVLPLVVARLADGPRRARRFAVGSAEAVRGLEAVLGTVGSNGHGPGQLSAEIAPADVVEYVRALAPDEVYVVVDRSADEEIVTLLGARLLMDGLPVHLVVPGLGAPSVRTTVTRLGRHTCISLAATGESRGVSALRRAADILGAALLLLCTAPIMLIVAALVRWTTGSPVIYAHERVGRFRKRFSLYKFRSMVPDAERILRQSPEIYRRYVAANYKLPEEEDPRITPLGRFLRRTSLDEMPQLWNVIRGDMSLIGPRPVVPEEVAEYGDYARLLLRVRPGLTGAWQVGGRSLITYPERARIDLQYVAARTLPQDVRILFRTVPAVLRRRGVV